MPFSVVALEQVLPAAARHGCPVIARLRYPGTAELLLTRPVIERLGSALGVGGPAG